MSDNDQYKIEKLEKNEVKPLLKEAFSLIFRTPLLSVVSGLVMFSLLYLSYLFDSTSLMYVPLLIIIPFFSYSFCKANDHSLPFWKLDFRHLKFTPLQYVFFIVLFTVISVIILFFNSFFPEDTTTTEEKKNLGELMILLIAFLVVFIFSILSSFIFVRCNFTSMLSFHCGEKWQLLNINLREDIKAIGSFHSIVNDGAEKSKMLLTIIGFLFYFSYFLIVYLFISNIFLIVTGFILLTLYLHHFLYVVIKHICNDGGINDKVKEKSFQFAEGM